MELLWTGKVKKLEIVIILFVLLYGLGLPYSTNASLYRNCWGEFEVLRYPFYDPSGERDICALIDTTDGARGAVARIIGQLILFAMALVLMAAAVGIVIGGYIYMTAGGSADRVQLAKTWIVAALLGITIALTSWVVLYTIHWSFT